MRRIIILMTLAFTLAFVVRVDAANRREVGFGQVRFNGLGPERWAQRYRREHRRVLHLRRERHALVRTLQSTPTVKSALSLACVVYGSCTTLHRLAWCESHYNANARNPSGASGLFQFLRSTWATTPFGEFSIFDPYANALAAGWMLTRGRGGEWACR